MRTEISCGPKGEKLAWFWFSVRIQTVKTWPIDPLGLRNIQLEVSEKFPQGELACGSQAFIATLLFDPSMSCPFCNTIVASKVYSGMIDHRNVCGHQFRVENGTMARTQHNHVCPHCGTIVTSSKASGRVRSEHRTPKGKMCPQKEWVVKS